MALYSRKSRTVRPIQNKLSFVEMNDWIISIQSRGDTRYIFLGTKSRLLLVILTVTILLWAVIASFLVVGNKYQSGNDHIISSDDLNSNLVTLLRERDNLIFENKKLINQTQKAIDLVYQQEQELNLLRKEIAELNDFAGVEFQNPGKANSSDIIGGATDPALVSTLSKVLSDSTENLRNSQDRIIALETEVQKGQNLVNASNRRMANLLNDLVDNIAVATSGIEDVLERVNVSPARIQEELRTLFRNQDQVMRGDLELETLQSLFDSPLSDDAIQLEAALEYMNLLNAGYHSLPFGKPLKGTFRTTSGYGMRKHPVSGIVKKHNGIDYGARIGTPVYATGNGIVEFVGTNGGFGKTIIIRHISGLRTIYAHLNSYSVKKGEFVAHDNKIGAVGSTGISTGPHLHYEITRNKKALNPLIFMEV